MTNAQQLVEVCALDTRARILDRLKNAGCPETYVIHDRNDLEQFVLAVSRAAASNMLTMLLRKHAERHEQTPSAN